MGSMIMFPWWVEVICSILCIIIVMLIIKGLYKNYLINILSRTKRVNAELISKVFNEYYETVIYGGGAQSRAIPPPVEVVKGLRPGKNKKAYLLYFKTDKGVVEFDVDKSVFESLKEGDKGVLEYKGNMYHSFEYS